jgi:short-subunit dehydrogenase
MKTFEGKRVLITGGGHGLGKAITQRFAQAGANVIVSDIDPERAASTAKELNAIGYSLDVTRPEQIAAVRDQLNREHGPIDILVNNAGVVFGGPFLKVPLAKHRLTIEVNLAGVVNATHTFLPDLLARPEAHVVNVVSASAVVALPWAATYAATKWAALGFSDSLREELRLQGYPHVGITAICPGYVDTGLFKGAKPPWLSRVLRPVEVAEAVLRAVRRRRQFVLLPRSLAWMYGLGRLLPRLAYQRLSAWLGVSTSMVGWQGRGAPTADS